MIYRFKTFTMDTELLELRSDSAPCTVEPQVFSLLAYLIENRDRVVGKDELIDSVWNGRIVSDATLNSRINSARRAVGDTGKAQSIIRTFPRRGFRFVADVEEIAEAQAQPAGDEVRAAARPVEQKPSIVVLPFKNLSGESEKKYFAAGITDDIITALSRVRWLFVISRNSAFGFSPETADISQLSHDLSVRYVLQGSVRADERRIRVTAQLVDGASGHNVWAEQYDGELVDIFDLQDRITSQIVSSLVPEISLAEARRTRQKRPENLDAWDRYMRALSLMYQLSPEANDLAKAEFGLSIGIDPNFAPARAGLAWCFILEAIMGWARRGRDAMDEALKHARTAVSLDEDDPRGCCALAAVYSWTSEQEAAEQAARRAIELDPNMSEAHGILGYALGFQGRPAESIAALERALKGSPRDHMRWLWYQGFANAHFAAGRYDEAIRWARKATDFRPNWIFGYAVAAASAAMLERLEQGAAAMTRVLDLYPRYNLERVRRNPMWTDNSIRDRFFDALMKAGIPS